MKRIVLNLALGTLALAAAPALAQHGGGGGGGGGMGGGLGNAGSMGGGMGSSGSMGGLGVGGMGPGSLDRGSPDTGISTRDSARINSQGPENADSTAIDRANSNSVLSGSTSTSTRVRRAARTSPTVTLPGAATTARLNSRGAANANSTAIDRANSHSVLSGSTSTTTRVPGSNRTTATTRVRGSARTTSTVTLPQAAINARLNSQGAAHASVNGLAHANSRSVLGGAGSTALLGVPSGATVTGTGGTSLGTVSSLVTNRAGAVVGAKVALAGGGTVTIPASQLSLSGSTLTTTWVRRH